MPIVFQVEALLATCAYPISYFICYFASEQCSLCSRMLCTAAVIARCRFLNWLQLKIHWVIFVEFSAHLPPHDGEE
jgi:hypothetical protein